MRTFTLSFISSVGIISCIPVDQDGPLTTSNASTEGTLDTSMGPTIAESSTDVHQSTDSTSATTPSTDSSASSTNSDSSSETSSPLCGNGTIDDTEPCDDGNAMDNDDCRNNCELAFCGDGVHNTSVFSVEKCDSSGIDTMACNADCTLPECGDNHINMAVGENCEDGNKINTDTCTNKCKAATCGDGILLQVPGSTEKCDDGMDSKTCDDDCTPVECGDLHVNQVVGEECDDLDAQNALDGCDTTCKRARIVFIADKLVAGMLGGLDGADLVCQTRATMAKVLLTNAEDRHFRAWLSDGKNSPDSRFKAQEGYYVNPLGPKVALNRTQLFKSPIEGLINTKIDDMGTLTVLVGQKPTVVTHTKANGTTQDTVPCSDAQNPAWSALVTKSPGVGTGIANNSTDKTWTENSFGDLNCYDAIQLYCFEDEE